MIRWFHWARGLKAKLIKSHLSVALIGTLLLVFSLIMFIWFKESTNALINVNIVSLQETENIQTGLQKSLAALRGWMAIPNQQFITDWQKAWQDDIDRSMMNLKILVKNHGDSQLNTMFQQLQANLINLHAWQWHIQDVAQKPGNHPEIVHLKDNMEPSAQHILSFATALVNTQSIKKSGEVLQVLKKLADFRGFFTNALATSIAYITTGNMTDLERSKNSLHVATQNMKWLTSHQQLFSDQQRPLFKNMAVRYRNYLNEYRRMLALKSKVHKSGVAGQWLSEQALPLVQRSEVLLDNMIRIETQKKQVKSDTVTNLILISTYLSVLFIIGMILLSLWLAVFNANRLLAPIKRLLMATQEMARGQLNETIEITSQDEIGELTASFNDMYLQRQQSEQKIQQTIETAVDAILTIDTKGIVQSCNTATTSLLGYTQTELIGKNISMIMPEPHRSEHDTYIKNYLETGIKRIIGTSRELEAQTKSGEVIPIMLSVSEIKVGDQHFFTGIIHDISQEKAQENAMKRLNSQLESDNLVKTVMSDFETGLRSIGTIELFADIILAFFSEKFNSPLSMFYISNEKENKFTLVKGFGYKERRDRPTAFSLDETLVGKCITSKKIMAIQDPPEGYMKVASGMGESLPKQIIILPLVFKDDVLGAVELCFFENQTQENMDMLQGLCDNAAIYLNLLRSKINLEKLLKQTKEQKQYLQQQEEELRSSNEELESQATALKQNEEELRSTNEELHTQVSLVEKQKEEIILKSHELEKVSKYKSEFLANMSHELRTPLNSLLILAQSFQNNREGNLTESQLEEAKIIYEAGSDLLILINDILDISKVEAGQLTLEIDSIDTNELLDVLNRQFTAIAKEKGLELIFDWDDKKQSQEFRTDQLRLLQILKNLMSNALKFTSKGSVTLKVACNDKEIHFSVIDTGIGIPKDKQELVFAEFQQADGSTSRQYGGTGLGLSISKKLAAMMQGSLSIESTEGKGSTFTLTLPLSSEMPADNQSDSTSPQNVNKTGEKVHIIEMPANIEDIPNEANDVRETIDPNKPILLIVDDDKKFCEILAKTIQENNFQVLIALTGGVGLQLAAAYQPVGLLLDLGLPDIPGEDVLQMLQQDSRTCGIPVHIVSARDKSESMTKSGAFSVLQKPIKEDDILQVLSLMSDTTERCILFVEDDLVTQKGIKEIFCEFSGQLSVDFAPTVKEAKAALSNKQFTCVIVDLNLPDASGLSLIEDLVNEMNLLIPIVVYTARELTSDEHTAIQKYTNKIVIKGERAIERLFDEVSLFINHLEKGDNMPTTTEQNECFTGKSVLLVDDDLRNTFALSRMLEQEGFNVVIADNGQLALEKLQTEGEFDIILMDMMMPVMDGADAIKQIREMDEFKKIPILALTARATEQDRVHCIEVGANDYMSKPLDVQALLKLMSVWLSN